MEHAVDPMHYNIVGFIVLVTSSYENLKYIHNDGIDIGFFPTFEEVSDTGVMRFSPHATKEMSSNNCQIVSELN